MVQNDNRFGHFCTGCGAQRQDLPTVEKESKGPSKWAVEPALGANGL